MKYIDTHSHIQFKTFDTDRDEIIQNSLQAGVEDIVAVGTDLASSQKAIEIAEKYPSVYAAVGIHPHHVFSYQSSVISYQQDMKEIGLLIKEPKVLAIGETGLDTHPYPATKYSGYQVTKEFLNLQEQVFIEHIKVAVKYQKTLIIHNRGLADRLLDILEENWDPFLSGRSVFHCCEPNKKVLEFAKKHQIFIGVDGDVTYDSTKQRFIQKVPLELIVLETDAPFFVPEPYRSQGISQNRPEYIAEISKFLDKMTHKNVQLMSRNNAQALFKLDS